MIYFIQNTITKNVKIGHSDDVEKRLKQLQCANDCPLTIVATMAGGPVRERRYHEEWHQYCLSDKGEWFSIDVYQEDDDVKIIGRKMQRMATPGKGRLTEKLLIRMTYEQDALLRRYVKHRRFSSKQGAVRFMINGLGDWFTRQEAKHTSATSIAPIAGEIDSGPPPVTDVEATDGMTSVGDFGGRLAVRLPESRHDGNE